MDYYKGVKGLFQGRKIDCNRENIITIKSVSVSRVAHKLCIFYRVNKARRNKV